MDSNTSKSSQVGTRCPQTTSLSCPRACNITFLWKSPVKLLVYVVVNLDLFELWLGHFFLPAMGETIAISFFITAMVLEI